MWLIIGIVLLLLAVILFLWPIILLWFAVRDVRPGGEIDDAIKHLANSSNRLRSMAGAERNAYWWSWMRKEVFINLRRSYRLFCLIRKGEAHGKKPEPKRKSN